MAIKIAGTEVISDDKRILNNESLPDIRPSLLLDFANSKTLDPRITFTRGSTATYYDGKATAKAEENLLRYSQNFNSGWDKVGVTVAVNDTTAPDGTTTAAKIEITTTGNYRGDMQIVSASTSTEYIATMYLKAGNHSYAGLQIQSRLNDSYVASVARIYIDLSDGSQIGTVTGTVTVTDVGNGWYKLTCSNTTASSGLNQIAVLLDICDSGGNTAPSTPIASGSNVYAWGAQVEQRSSATAYTPTTSSPIVKYQPVLQTAASGEARFDHDPVTGESKGLLIEEARTNLSANSVPVTGWAVNPHIELMGYAAAPDGTLTAPYYMQIGTGSDASVNNTDISITPSASTNYVISCFIKQAPDGYDKAIFFNFFLGNSTKGSRFEYTFSTDTLAASEADGSGVVPFNYGREFVGNGWVRVWFVVNDANNGLNSILGTRFYAGGRDINNYQGLIVWGFQVEQGSFPTSYIPTSGSTVTRARDDVDMTGTNFSQWFNPTEGTILADFDYTYNESGTGYPRIWSITEDSSIQNRMGVLINETANGLTQELYSVNSGQVSIAYQLSSLTGSATAKSSFAYAEDNFGVSANGSLGTDTSGSIAASPPRSRMRLGGLTTAGGDHRQAWIKKWAYYPKRLPNATLQAMTEA